MQIWKVPQLLESKEEQVPAVRGTIESVGTLTNGKYEGRAFTRQEFVLADKQSAARIKVVLWDRDPPIPVERIGCQIWLTSPEGDGASRPSLALKMEKPKAKSAEAIRVLSCSKTCDLVYGEELVEAVIASKNVEAAEKLLGKTATPQTAATDEQAESEAGLAPATPPETKPITKPETPQPKTREMSQAEYNTIVARQAAGRAVNAIKIALTAANHIRDWHETQFKRPLETGHFQAISSTVFMYIKDCGAIHDLPTKDIAK